jgi:hypothetical protein
MIVTVKAALGYTGVVFGAGFLLGTLRVVLLERWLGSVIAVLLELPLMLGVSWLACGAVLGRFRVSTRLGPRLGVGSLAFMLLMLAEAGVSVLGFGRTLAEHLATYRATSAQLGLLAQIAFALFPIAQPLIASRAQRHASASDRYTSSASRPYSTKPHAS